MAHELKSAGDNTATYSFIYQYSGGNFLGPDDWAQLPNGRLKTLLLKTYTETMGGPSKTQQFYDALAEEGFSATLTWAGEANPTATLLSGSGPALIGYDNHPLGDGSCGVLRIAITQSVSL